MSNTKRYAVILSSTCIVLSYDWAPLESSVCREQDICQSGFFHAPLAPFRSFIRCKRHDWLATGRCWLHINCSLVGGLAVLLFLTAVAADARKSHIILKPHNVLCHIWLRTHLALNARFIIEELSPPELYVTRASWPVKLCLFHDIVSCSEFKVQSAAISCSHQNVNCGTSARLWGHRHDSREQQPTIV